MVEYKGKNISLLQQAGLLLRDPAYLNPDVARLVGKAKKSEPPIQSIYGKLPIGSIPFFIPLDLLPSSACILAADGSCASWLHKAGFPGQTECGGGEWLVHATMIILSAIQTEVRKANLIVDWDDRDPEAWEDWDIRRLQVGSRFLISAILRLCRFLFSTGSRSFFDRVTTSSIRPFPCLPIFCVTMAHDNSNIYLAVTLGRSSPFYTNPSGLSTSYSAVNHVGNVGQLPDVQLFSVPKVEWDSRQQDILSFLKGSEGVQRVDVQSPRTRSKRDEF